MLFPQLCVKSHPSLLQWVILPERLKVLPRIYYVYFYSQLICEVIPLALWDSRTILEIFITAPLTLLLAVR